MKTIAQILSLSTEYLKEKNSLFGRLEAEQLISRCLGMKRFDLYLNFDKPLEESELFLIRQRLGRLAKNEPLQYIEGSVSFYGCSLFVNRHVLIPRPETELLVDSIVTYLKGKDLTGKSLWDIGTGSGCIGIAIKKALPMLRVTLSDVSKEALEVAKKNSFENSAALELLHGDLLAPFGDKKADFIVSNPPYISESDYVGLDDHVKNFEPRGALVGGSTGLELYKRLALELKDHMKSGGCAWLELGAGQREAVEELLHAQSYQGIQSFKDFSGHDRFVQFVCV
jgi:release factor glutamine methyltransferase